MDPNPNEYPILSFVMSQTPHFQRPPPPPPPLSHMPHLSDPEVLMSMKLAISEVTKTRESLQTLRPDQESVHAARAKIAEIDAILSEQREENNLSTIPGAMHWFTLREKRADEDEKKVYNDVIELDGMHQAYEKLFSDYEEKLVKISGVFAAFDQEAVGVLQERVVKLTGCALRVLPGALGNLIGVIVLNLSKNCLEVIPDSIWKLEKLEELYLSSNNLKFLPDSIGWLFNLKLLDVSSNMLIALPDSITNCRSLEELNASSNKLTELPANIGFGLKNLRRLSVHLNDIGFLPASICELRCLQDLDVHFNKICFLPTYICRMSHLRRLDVHFNQLCGLPDTIGGLTNLEVLNLSKNFSDLTGVPDTMGDLINLKELDLSSNQIRVLPITFGRLNNLTKLNLECNPLVTPPVDVVDQGVEAVKEFMAKRWAEEQKSGGWLTRSTSRIKKWVSGISKKVSTDDKNAEDPFLDQIVIN